MLENLNKLLSASSIGHFYLLNLGIIKDERYNKYEIYLNCVYTGMNVILMAATVISYFQSKESIYKFMAISSFLSVCMAFIIRKTVRKDRKNVLQLVSNLSEKDEFSVETVNVNMMRIMYKEFLPRLLPQYVMVGIMGAIPFLAFFVKSPLDYNDPDIYFLPYIFHYWKVSSALECSILLFLQMCTCLPILLLSYTGLTFFCYVLAHLEAHLQQINLRFSQIISEHTRIKMYRNFVTSLRNAARGNLYNLANHMRMSHLLLKMLPCETEHKKGLSIASSQMLPLWRKENLKNFTKDFIQLIKYHQYLHKYQYNFIQFIDCIFRAVILWIVPATATLVFNIMQMKGNLHIIVIARFLAFAICFLLTYYICCFAGGVINKMNERQTYCFYNTLWYELDPEFRELMITVMILLQRNKILKVYGMYIFDLSLFTKTLKIIYSIVNMLLAIQKKNT